MNQRNDYTCEDADDFADLQVTLPSGQVITVAVLTSGADGSALVQIDTSDEPSGNVRVLLNDCERALFDANPETGKYEGKEVIA